jgi:pimeloyl-ACP methyl ester carboxylesterase
MVPSQPAVVTNAAAQSSLRRLDLGAIQLEFQERGSGDPVLLIHAALLADWFIPLLAQTRLTRRCRLISYHRAGFAGSSPATAPLSIVDQARHAREVLAELGISRAHLVGHSSGACIALQLALDAPDLVQSLALLEPVVASGPAAEEFAQTEVGPAFGCYAAGDRAGAVDLFLRAVGGPGYRPLIERTLGASAVRQLHADADTFFQVEGPSAMAWQFGEAEAARVQQPVLLLTGGDSREVYHEGHKWLLERLSLVEGLVMPGANHLLPLQQPQHLSQTLARFFALHPINAPTSTF